MNFPARMAVTLGAAESTGCARQIAGANAKHRARIIIIVTDVLEGESQDRLAAAVTATGGDELMSITYCDLSLRCARSQESGCSGRGGVEIDYSIVVAPTEFL
jgi:hypothetical protein